MSRWSSLLILPAIALGLAGCSSDAVKPVSAEDLQVRIAESVEDELDTSPSVLCPAPLAARVDAEATCKITGTSTPLIAKAKVTAVDEATGEVSIAVSVSEDVTAERSDAPSDPAASDSADPSESTSATPTPSTTSK
ncbi:MAG: DUF4333 domain-containing protein [Bowdeniella nasicola]|nr:DUF4333 domain-containing protein [Bowdeniella nasicola]